MKLLKGNGRTLEVWDVTEVIVMKLRAGRAPIKHHGWQLLPDDQARVVVSQLLEQGAVRTS